MAARSLFLAVFVAALIGAAQAFDPMSYVPLVAQKAMLTNAQTPNKTMYPAAADYNKPWSTSPAAGWTSGFYPGILWQLYNITGNSTYMTLAQEWTEGIKSQQYNNGTHDVGFMVYYSFGLGHQLTQSAEYSSVVKQTALSLSQRFNPLVGCTQSWGTGGPYNYHFPVITDNLMNLELLYYAQAIGGPAYFADMANSHCDRTIVDNVDSRGDNSSIHLIDYDPTTGNVIAKMNYPQGRNASDGCWSRGQAWAIYGYTMAYRYTRIQKYLDVAQGLADYALAHAPADLVPVWDYSAPADQAARDSSAAAIAVSGLIELSTYLTGAAKEKYKAAAEAMFISLTHPNYLAPAEWPEVLINATSSYPAANQSLIYGDYYFLEFIARWNYHYGQKAVPQVPIQAL